VSSASKQEKHRPHLLDFVARRSLAADGVLQTCQTQLELEFALVSEQGPIHFSSTLQFAPLSRKVSHSHHGGKYCRRARFWLPAMHEWMQDGRKEGRKVDYVTKEGEADA
jgi:hypothetical protein